MTKITGKNDLTDIYLRGYVDYGNPPVKPSEQRSKHNKSILLSFDTETTNDKFQNLLIGSCAVKVSGQQKELYVFYNEDLLTSRRQKEIDIIKGVASQHNAKVLTRKEYVEQVFYPYVYTRGAICLGFNLPFDISRLATRFTYARKKGFENGFSFTLSDNLMNPDIVIKHLDSKKAFIQFTNQWKKNSKQKYRQYPGYFLDLKTLVFALTNSSYDLKHALIDFDCKRRKMDTEEHGKITPEYVEYNINDTLATMELYEKAMERYQSYGVTKDARQLYSPASISKAYHDMMGIKSFKEKNPNFPKNILGYTMSTYYGGRTETRIRKTPVRVTYLDFTSMYPSLYILLGMDKMLKAAHIRPVVNTVEVQELINKITLNSLGRKETWKQMTTICKIRPNEDVLPVRAKYNGTTRNIGINHLTSTDECLWFTLPDIIASKLFTGKTPIIEQAVTFVPVGVQDGLREIKIPGGTIVRPDEDFIQKLIEERMRLKKEMKTKSGDERKRLDIEQNNLKIIANSGCYGIFIEVITSKSNGETADVYGLGLHHLQPDKMEKEGPAFCPPVGVFMTSGARLILAMAETLIKDNKGYFAYGDTDSLFISPEHEKLLQEFFAGLNPYNINVDMFKVEEDKNGRPLRDIWFMGISSKRYVLYALDPNINILKYSSHGLGHLQGIEDQEGVWKDILTIHYHPDMEDEILKKYEDRVAVSQLTISSYDILKRFKTTNKGKPLKEQLKPFNFISIGMGYKDPKTRKSIMPMMGYISPKDKKFREIPYMDFIDYRTGEQYPHEGSMDTKDYWRPLRVVIEKYMIHSESKMEGDIGELKRRHLVTSKAFIHLTGKESNALEKSMVLGADDENYTDYDTKQDIVQRITNMTTAQAKKKGIPESTLMDWKKKIREGKQLTLKKSMVKRLLS